MAIKYADILLFYGSPKFTQIGIFGSGNPGRNDTTNARFLCACTQGEMVDAKR
jgi:hypothetical protein